MNTSTYCRTKVDSLTPRINKLRSRIAEAEKHFAVKQHREIGRYINELQMELRPLVKDQQRYLSHAGVR